MRYLVDTNIWVYLMKNEPEAVNVIREASRALWAGYSAITRLELLGFSGLTISDEQKIKTVLGEFFEIAVSSDIIDRAIIIRKERKIKVPDAIIASTALACNATIITRNVDDFEKIKHLKILNPFK